ncbi:metal-dependent transcriptional regulator [Nitrososphaera sp. AFS]|uniref:metal-dependent transcriptional regulator n=1 Tax=Nitrososphaera sp. AFS TaxID=2301191 RepID=UPI001F3D3CF0|nr:iron dependent repressor, metal binding and dimerization domain protein [Nitrososphaera sp. AFS]
MRKLKVRLNKNNEDNHKHLKLIRDAHSIKPNVIAEPQTHRMEDYLEVIYELTRKKGYATQTDLSESLNVSLPGVTKMLQRLDENKFLKYEKYRGVNLTEKGIEVAKSIHEKHSLLSEFFKMIGVHDDVANIDAEGIEHHLHSQTLKKLREFIENQKKGI